MQPNLFSHAVVVLSGLFLLIVMVVAVVRDRRRRNNGHPWPEWTKSDEAAQARDKLNTWQG